MRPADKRKEINTGEGMSTSHDLPMDAGHASINYGLARQCLLSAPLFIASMAMAAEPGLTAERFGSPALERFAESGSAPDLGPMDKGERDWGLRFSGVLAPPTDGEYAFRSEADTGVRVKINNELIIDGWGKGAARTGKATLAKDKPVPIVVEYFFDKGKGGAKAALRLFWTPPGGQEVPVPPAAYMHVPLSAPPIVVLGDEQSRVNMQLPDGGLKPMVGVLNIQVFRSCRAKPETADQDGWTYAHHMDLAVWNGRLYAAWAMTPKDEDVPPYKVVYATSTNGMDWSSPSNLFPRENAWACRFYFYRAANGRMLAFCAGKSVEGTVTEAAKKVLLVREITADHRLGEVFTLIAPAVGQPPSFETATDAGFVAACREAAANNLLLEQQDYGVFLGERRMKWHDDPALKIQGWCQFGKAFCFYHRADGDLVGLCKMGFATLSDDAGKNWSKPVQPPTLIAGSGKIWGQRTADGRYALAYNPDPGRQKRFPLVIVHGDDGREFRDMRAIHGELSPLRYPGKYKGLGAQYVRGLPEWADDGTFADQQAMWLVYSVNKEDIWVSRIPLPLKPDETAFPDDDFATATPGAVVPGWNLYSPKRAPVSVVENAGKRSLELHDGDPFDYARAVRVFPEAAKVRAELRLQPLQANARLEIDLCAADGRRPVRVSLTETGLIQAADGATLRDLGTYAAHVGMTVTITTDLAAARYAVQVNDGPAQSLAVAEPGCKTVQRLSLRTGVWRGVADSKGVDPATDVPLPTPAVFQVQRIKIGAP